MCHQLQQIEQFNSRGSSRQHFVVTHFAPLINRDDGDNIFFMAFRSLQSFWFGFARRECSMHYLTVFDNDNQLLVIHQATKPFVSAHVSTRVFWIFSDSSFLFSVQHLFLVDSLMMLLSPTSRVAAYVIDADCHRLAEVAVFPQNTKDIDREQSIVSDEMRAFRY